MKNNTDAPKILSDNTFPVVGIGASAGGLEAFKKLISAIPDHSGMAYVLVQHLDPRHESILPALLQRVTNIPVLEISDKIQVQPDHIYIIPSNKMLVANDGVLQLSPRPEKTGSERNLPIDLFFTSLAEVHQAHSIGVVLSGTASDGTAGLRAIKDHGGITFAQDEASAAYEGMPQSAALAGVVDFILPPEEIPKKLLEVKQQIIRSDEDLENLPQQEEAAFKQILLLLRIRKGTDFTYYKQTTVRRRILRRMAVNKSAGVVDYVKFLKDHKAEQDALYQDLLIPVTAFFRDPKVFETLCMSVFPGIVQAKADGDSIRIWVAGCSTGQEAYSMAMCLKEAIGDRALKLQVFASDISEPAIARARKGLYTKAEVADVPEHRLEAFFTKFNGQFYVARDVRELCVFAVHNFLKDPPFGRMDLVSCRNSLIYMEPYLQKRALTTFHYALKPKAFLLLGKSETSTSTPELFATADRHDKLFTRKDVPARFMHVTGQQSEHSLSTTDLDTKSDVERTDFSKIADELLLSNYTPAGVVISETMDIVHFRGNTGNYLEQASGKPSHNLLKMARSGLGFELRSVIQKATSDQAAAKKEHIPLEIGGMQHLVSIEAVPLPNMVEPHYLVLFYETPAPPSAVTSENGPDAKDLRIRQLEKELVQTREDMRGITEEQETANEELQSANEELLSGSEELQSLNEELETSKEELQSTNQELTNVNEQISEARLYAETIVATIREPLLVLDKGLRVKTANQAFYDTFRINAQETEGQLIYDLSNRSWDIPLLRDLIEGILARKTHCKDFEVTHDFPIIGPRVMLLNACEMTTDSDGEKLILLAIEDITERKLLQAKEQELSDKFQSMVQKAPVAICVLKGKDYVVELANDFYRQIVGEKNHMLGASIFESLPELAALGIKELLDKVVASKMPLFGYELALTLHRNKKDVRCFFNLVYQPIPGADEAASEVIVVLTEVTDQVDARKKMEVQTLMMDTLLMSAPGFICTMAGPDHVYEMVNDRYQQLFGKRKIQGKSLLEALPELEGQGFAELLDNVYKTGEPYVGIDLPITVARDEGLAPELRFFNFSYQPMYNDDHQIYSILVFGYEVTEQVNARNKILELQQKQALELEEKVEQRTLELSEANNLLLQKNEELIRVNKELESFTYVSSHDLREPLRKIQTFSALILHKEHETLSDGGKDSFKRLEQATKRMGILLDDLLTYSHAGQQQHQFEHADLDKIVEEVKAELSEIIEERHAVIDVTCSGHVYINAFQFRQVMTNLIANALKFSTTDVPPHISIKGRIGRGLQFRQEAPGQPLDRLSPENNYCHITIADNGIGFDQLYKDRIFEVFQRLHSKEAYSGTGIGLAIVKKIIENHNGIITASGESGKGARFDIYIPANQH